jgi:hypothetical protein
MDAVPESQYDLNGLVRVAITGSDSQVGQIMDETLRMFRSDWGEVDLKLVLGEYPSKSWKPSGLTVGDRLLYDSGSDSTTVFRKPTTAVLSKSDVEYVILGDFRKRESKVTVYVPALPERIGYFRSIMKGLVRRSLARTLLAVSGSDSYSMEGMELAAAKVRLAVLEPFLYYRLPFKGSTLVHGSVVSANGSGLMFAGGGHIGKTALSLEMVKRGYSYLGDDLAIVSEGGQAFPYPEPIRIQEQHLALFPDLESKLTSGMGATERFFFRRLLRHSPGEVLELMPRLPISELFAGARIGGTCRLDNVILIRKGVIQDPIFEEIDLESIAGALAAELFWEFEAGHWRHNQYIYCPSCAKGTDFLAEEREHGSLVTRIIADSLRGSKVFRLQVPYEFKIREATTYIDKVLKK